MEETANNNSLGDIRVLLYFALAPLAYVVLLMYLMPERVPMHIDMLGGITRWWSK
jgi:hypothetical protein